MNSNGIISAPVSIDDVKTVLGESSNDLMKLCTSPKINMWAKYKPVSYASPSPLSEASLANACYGIQNIPYWESIQKMVGWFNGTSDSDPENTMSSKDMWIYAGPSGGYASPYRLSDFKDYFHGATAPIGPLSSTTLEENFEGDVALKFPLGIQDDHHRDLRLSDLTNQYVNFSQLYFGVLFLNGSSYYVITGNQLMADGNGGVINFTDSGKVLPGKTWKVIPLASSAEIDSLQSGYNNTGKFVPLFPAISNLSVTAMQVVISQSLGASYVKVSDKSIHVVYTLTNQSGDLINVGEIDYNIQNSSGTSLGSGMLKSSDLTPVAAGDNIQYESSLQINTTAMHAYRVNVSVNIAGSTYTCQALVQQVTQD